MKKPYMIEFPQHGDDRGWLVVAEGCKDVPFDIRRIFYIYGSDSQVVRGKHANRNSEFVLVNVAGTCKVKVTDLSTGGGGQVYSLDRPNVGLYLPARVWKEMYDFSPDSILLCLSSHGYDPAEYIRSFEEYARLIREGKL